MRRYLGIFWSLLIGSLIIIFSVCADKSPEFINSIGTKMILIQEGTFLMGGHSAQPTGYSDVKTRFIVFQFDINLFV